MIKKVFIVEDDPDISELMQMVVQNEGYFVEVFSELDTIEDAALEKKPNLIVMDLTIGSTDSSVFVRRLKKK